MILLATPPFFLGLLLILAFALRWPIFPAGGWWGSWPDNFRYLVLPAIAMSAFLMPQIARTVRQVALDTSRQDFIEAAIARGMSPRTIMLHHILPNSLLPVLTLLGLNLGSLIASAAVVESVFGIPGVGSSLVQSVSQRDYPLIQGIAVVSALFVVFANATRTPSMSSPTLEPGAADRAAHPARGMRFGRLRPTTHRPATLVLGGASCYADRRLVLRDPVCLARFARCPRRPRPIRLRR